MQQSQVNEAFQQIAFADKAGMVCINAVLASSGRIRITAGMLISCERGGSYLLAVLAT